MVRGRWAQVLVARDLREVWSAGQCVNWSVPGPQESFHTGPGSVFRRVWNKARKAVLDDHEYASPVGRRVYDLRHTCLTTWLDHGIPPAQVAEWAGDSVPVLLATYARCITGQLTELQARIEGPQQLPAAERPRQNFGTFSGRTAAEGRSKPAPTGQQPSPAPPSPARKPSTRRPR